MRTKVVDERITVAENGDASCVQEVKYINHDDKPFTFSGIEQIRFHVDCCDFEFSEGEDLIFPRVVDVKEGPYQKTLQFQIPAEIPSKGSISLKLEYLWRKFQGESGFKNIATEFDSIADYSLTIKVHDDTFSHHLISVTDGDNPLQKDRDYLISEEGHLHIFTRHISPETRQRIRIYARIRRIPLPVVSETGKNYEGCFSNDLCVLVVLHLLTDFLPFCDGLRTMGIDQEGVFIVGIPYSSKDHVIRHLQHMGYKVFSVERDEYINKFNNLVETTLKSALKHCKKNKKRLLIIEDGGYAVPLIHRKFKRLSHLCIGAVEQTANGIWANREIEEQGKLLFPVMNVAESGLKTRKESPLVGRAILQNVNRLLDRGYGESLHSLKVGQIGFGNIGSRLGIQMKNEGIGLTVYEIDEIKLGSAEKHGISTAPDIDQLIREKNIIIGCSGRELVGLRELRSADRNIYFVNATSKLKEIKHAEFMENVEHLRIKRGVGSEYQLKGGKQIVIRLLANGFPVNFFESSESIPDQEIQFIPALLLASAGHLVKNEISERRIITIPDDIQDDIVKIMNSYDKSY